MAMMVVSADDFNSELELISSGSVVRDKLAKIVDIKRGRGSVNEVPTELRKVIAGEKINGASNPSLAKAFNVSESSVSAYAHDATSTASYHSPDKELKKSNDSVRTEITDAARTKLIDAIRHITSDKLGEAKVRDVAGIAKDMSAVIRNMEPATATQVNQNAQFVFYTPTQKTEKDYDIIDSSE